MLLRPLTATLFFQANQFRTLKVLQLTLPLQVILQ